MQITIALPDQLAEQLDLQPDALTRCVLELIVADQYRQGRIGAGEVRQILNLASRWETYSFFKQEQAYLPYSEADLEQDSQAIRRVLASE
ncbi:MAG: UPF0175 family protein [Elainella sp.]